MRDHLIPSILIVTFIAVFSIVKAQAPITYVNPWVIIKTSSGIVWVKQDKIISVSDNIDPKMRDFQGKTTLSLVNGQKLYFNNYTARELIDLINRSDF